MLWLIQASVVSLIVIYVIHNLYSFFKETLTVPKIKDMVKRPQQKYEMLFRELRDQVANNGHNGNSNNNNNSNSNNSNSNNSNSNNSNSNNINSNNSNDDMKNELKQYLMDLNASHSEDPYPQSDTIEFGSVYK